MARRTTPKTPTPRVFSEPSRPQILEPIVIPPSEDFKAALISELTAMQQARRDEHRVPDHVTYRELERHIASALNALYSEGWLQVGNTVNDKYMRTTDQADNGESH